MNINQSNKGKAVNWEYLPDTSTISKYLERKDLIELSKSCKRHRNQLERRVLENLNLNTWCSNNWNIYSELGKSKNYKKILKYMKIDLGTKIKFAQKLTLNRSINYLFAKKIVKLFPNIKSLVLIENEDGYEDCYFPERSLVAILKGMKNLEYVGLEEFRMSIDKSKSKTQIFPKSLKSLKIYRKWGIYCEDNNLMIYDTIDSEYQNLRFLSIGSNRMLQNLPYGVPNLQSIDIKAEGLDKEKLVEFLKSNPQLKKINICTCYNEEIINTVLSFKSLEQLRICTERWREIRIEANNLSSNHSIKSLSISRYTSGHLSLQLANSCKNLKTLELEDFNYLKDINWSNFERRDNILKLSDYSISLDVIKKIDNSRLFNQIRFKLDNSIESFIDDNSIDSLIDDSSIESFIDDYNIDKLENYKFTHSIGSTINLKLINQ